MYLILIDYDRKRKYNATNGTVNDTVNGTVNDTVNKNEQAIINLLKTKPGINASEISERTSKSLRTSMRYLKSLHEKGLIEFRGVPKTGGYYLK